MSTACTTVLQNGINNNAFMQKDSSEREPNRIPHEQKLLATSSATDIHSTPSLMYPFLALILFCPVGIISSCHYQKAIAAHEREDFKVAGDYVMIRDYDVSPTHRGLQNLSYRWCGCSLRFFVFTFVTVTSFTIFFLWLKYNDITAFDNLIHLNASNIYADRQTKEERYIDFVEKWAEENCTKLCDDYGELDNDRTWNGEQKRCESRTKTDYSICQSSVELGYLCVPDMKHNQTLEILCPERPKDPKGKRRSVQFVCQKDKTTPKGPLPFAKRYNTTSFHENCLPSLKNFWTIPDEHDEDYQQINPKLTVLCKAINVLEMFPEVAKSVWLMVFIEAVLLHTLISNPFVQLSLDFVTRYALIGWTCSIIPTIGWAIQYYADESVSCLRKENSATFLTLLWVELPIYVIAATNFVLLMHILYMMSQNNLSVPNPEAESSTAIQDIRKLAKATLVLVPLFGVHVLVSIIIPFKRLSEYVEHFLRTTMLVIDSLSGVIVACCYCFLNDDVLSELRRVWERRKYHKPIETTYARSTVSQRISSDQSSLGRLRNSQLENLYVTSEE
ncbi:Oidioi.mRNA.OKI2018_I69.XSR.g15344.t1.cds [Oikopleura dioica]|uniref:Oidioi.mRNA.OKI2018_I69.XSR.g15344.t1.cds n=1 Tax=Oikopleura dioica TaxID=34765 RepID=A0ABN7SGR7_OIKDI|nr:Oidioi.mRNA.OKI2018_I69.XSR.g15344.t1.cds [Oikopleura dioica]